MEEKNKKKISFIGLFLLIGIFLISSVSATDFEINFTDFNTYRSSSTYANIQVKSLKYEPYPVNPGEYFTLWIKAENIGSILTENAYFELVPEYPFSLDSNENSVREYGKLPSEEPVILEYKGRVDEDAVEGTNEIKIRYNTDGDNSYWIYKKFDIEVDDAQTDFDVVIQEIADSEVSIAIANIGKSTANSVVVRIPEQEGFKATGTDGQMVGNLDAGDYSIVSFSLIPLMQGDSQKKNLKFDIYYTDTIGERRVVNMGTPLKISSGGSDIQGSKKRMKLQEENSGINWTLWIVLGIIMIVCFLLFKKYTKQKKSDNSSKSVPDWMKNAKDKK